MRIGDPESLGRRLAQSVRRFTDKKLDPVVARLDVLELRLAELEQRKSAEAFPYRGVYKFDVDYSRGNFVTDHGSLWIALADTRGRPGHSDDWQLCVKRGGAAR